MIKKCLLPFLILLTGCSDPLDEFIYSTGARLCGHFIVLGDSVSIDEEMPAVKFSEENQTYSIDCNETGAYVIGSGTNARQLLTVDELTFSTNKENRVDSLSGRWRILTESGFKRLDTLKASADSSAYSDSIQYLQQTQKLANDIRQIQFELQEEFDQPDQTQPLSWKSQTAEISFHTKVFEDEVHFYVSTQIE